MRVVPRELIALVPIGDEGFFIGCWISEEEQLFKPVSSKPDFVAMELKTLDFWKESKAFDQLVRQNQGHAHFSFIDGPITANNPMGVHHAWGRTYKDLFQRYQAMLGKDERYQN